MKTIIINIAKRHCLLDELTVEAGEFGRASRREKVPMVM